jgi:hypothetical protein
MYLKGPLLFQWYAFARQVRFGRAKPQVLALSGVMIEAKHQELDS